MRQFYSFIFHYLEENKLKISRWKLQQYILIPTKKLLMKWRIANNSQCNFCGQDENTYFIFFLFLVFNDTFSSISAISWRPVLVVEEAKILGENTTNIE